MASKTELLEAFYSFIEDNYDEFSTMSEDLKGMEGGDELPPYCSIVSKLEDGALLKIWFESKERGQMTVIVVPEGGRSRGYELQLESVNFRKPMLAEDFSYLLEDLDCMLGHSHRMTYGPKGDEPLG
jgi:hypothetical protein